MATTPPSSSSSLTNHAFLSVLFPDDITTSESDSLTGMGIAPPPNAQVGGLDSSGSRPRALSESIVQSEQPGEDSSKPSASSEPNSVEDADAPDGEQSTSDTVEARLKVSTLDVSGFQASTEISDNTGTNTAESVETFDTIGAPNTEEETTVINGDSDNQALNSSEPSQRLEPSQQVVIEAIVASNADILGLTGLCNDGYGETSTLQTLVDTLNAQLGNEVYAAIELDSPQLGSQASTVGIIYKPAVVNPVGEVAVLDTGAFAQEDVQTPDAAASDPTPQGSDIAAEALIQVPLAQSFAEIETGEVFTAVVTDFLSEPAPEPSDHNLETAPEPSDYNLEPVPEPSDHNPIPTLTQAAQELADWLSTNPTQVFDSDVLILGNFSTAPQTEPSETLELAGYAPLVIPNLVTPDLDEPDIGSPSPETPTSGGAALSNAALTEQVASVNGQFFEVEPKTPAVEDSEADPFTSDIPTADDPSLSENFRPDPGDAGDEASDPLPADPTPFTVGLNLEKRTIEGTQQRDSLIGTAADEILIGLESGDLITTGDGYDTLVYTSMRDGGDRISDFSPLHDRIVLTELFQASDISASTFTDAISLGYLSVQERGEETWLRFDTNGNSTGRTLVILEGVSVDDLSDRNFII